MGIWVVWGNGVGFGGRGWLVERALVVSERVVRMGFGGKETGVEWEMSEWWLGCAVFLSLSIYLPNLAAHACPEVSSISLLMGICSLEGWCGDRGLLGLA